MFENYISSNFNALISQIDLTGKYLKKDDIFKESLPDFLKNYFTAEINYLIYKDKLERTANPNFDFSNEEFLKKINELDSFYRENAKFSKYEIEDLVKSAVQIRLNFLIRPIHTLIWFVFKEELTKSLKEIIMKLNYFSDYPYLTEELIKELEDDNGKHKDILISFAEFKQRLVNIDLNYTKDKEIEELVNTLPPLFDFFGLENNKNEPAIPAGALVIYLDDKGYKPLAGYLEKKYINIPEALLSKSEIIKILENLEDSFNNYRDEDLLNQNMNAYEATPVETVDTAEMNDELPAEADYSNQDNIDAATENEIVEAVNDLSEAETGSKATAPGSDVKSKLQGFLEKYS